MAGADAAHIGRFRGSKGTHEYDGWPLVKIRAPARVFARGKSGLGCRVALPAGRQKVGARRKAGRSDPTDADEALRVVSSYKGAVETGPAGQGGERRVAAQAARQ